MLKVFKKYISETSDMSATDPGKYIGVPNVDPKTGKPLKKNGKPPKPNGEGFTDKEMHKADIKDTKTKDKIEGINMTQEKELSALEILEMYCDEGHKRGAGADLEVKKYISTLRKETRAQNVGKDPRKEKEMDNKHKGKRHESIEENMFHTPQLAGIMMETGLVLNNSLLQQVKPVPEPVKIYKKDDLLSELFSKPVMIPNYKKQELKEKEEQGKPSEALQNSKIIW